MRLHRPSSFYRPSSFAVKARCGSNLEDKSSISPGMKATRGVCDSVHAQAQAEREGERDVRGGILA